MSEGLCSIPKADARALLHVKRPMMYRSTLQPSTTDHKSCPHAGSIICVLAPCISCYTLFTIVKQECCVSTHADLPAALWGAVSGAWSATFAKERVPKIVMSKKTRGHEEPKTMNHSLPRSVTTLWGIAVRVPSCVNEEIRPSSEARIPPCSASFPIVVLPALGRAHTRKRPGDCL